MKIKFARKYKVQIQFLDPPGTYLISGAPY